MIVVEVNFVPSSSTPRRKGRKKIPDSERLAVWVRSGGRCAICNRYLLRGGMTYREVSLGELAHIVGQQKTVGSPRGLADLAGRDRDRADNLMLVCGDEHREIDDLAAVDVFTVERLVDLKRRHEDRIEHVTGMAEDRSTTVIRMLAPVRGNEIELTRETAATTVIRGADRFPRFLESYHRHGLEIDLRHLPGEMMAGPDYYRSATAQIDKAIGRLTEGVVQDEVAHLSVFAFARLPLLVYLGARLDDAIPTDIYQRHRIDESWDWAESGAGAIFRVEVARDVPAGDEAVLVMNLSGTIHLAEVPNDLAGLRTYVVAPTNAVPGPNIMRGRPSLDAFEQTIRGLFSSLEATAKSVRRLHVLPAMPLSPAIVMGRVRDPHVHPALFIYDRTDAGYRPALEIS